MSTVLKDEGKFYPRTCHEALEREYRYNCTVSLTWRPMGVGCDIHSVTGLVSPEMVISFTVSLTFCLRTILGFDKSN